MKTIKCMMEHLYWADGRILDALEESETKNKELLKLVRNVAVAERVWLSRLQGRGSAEYQLWEEADDLMAIRTMFEENAEQYRVYIDGLKESELDEMTDYTNQSGVPFQTSVRDILSQVLLHGQYHRGQINRALRIESAEPVQVDYITFARLLQFLIPTKKELLRQLLLHLHKLRNLVQMQPRGVKLSSNLMQEYRIILKYLINEFCYCGKETKNEISLFG